MRAPLPCALGDNYSLVVTQTSSGRSPAGRATRPAAQAPTGLGDTASVPSAGQWVVLKSYRAPEVRQIAKVTPMLVKLEGGQWPRQRPRMDIIACLDDKDAAMTLAQSLAGAAGHREERIRKARADFEERKAGAWAEYERTEARLVASAIEAARQRRLARPKARARPAKLEDAQ